MRCENRKDVAFQWMYLLLSNRVEKALAESELEKMKALLREAREQAEIIYRRSGRKNDILMEETGRLRRCFDFNLMTEQLMNLRSLPGKRGD